MARRLGAVLAALLMLLGAATAAAEPVPPGSLYLALGDSVAAGHGLGDPTDQPDAALCTRSQHAYPALLARSPYFANPLGAGGSLACSGAVSAHLFGASQVVDGPSGPVGLAPQLAVVRALGLAPATVTVTVGANDVRYNAVVAACLKELGSGPGGPCARQAPTVALSLENLDENLIELFGDIQALPGNQRIFATGYYDPIPEDLTDLGDALACGLFGISVRDAQYDGDYAYIQTYLGLLNGTIARAAASSGATYVDITHVFDGHRFCSDVPWAVPPSAATVADGSAFHPTALGQEAIAQALIRAAGGTTPVITGAEAP
jgi:lysophospholipase L1-like esterase